MSKTLIPFKKQQKSTRRENSWGKPKGDQTMHLWSLDHMPHKGH
jgi:hypothetical protein